MSSAALARPRIIAGRTMWAGPVDEVVLLAEREQLADGQDLERHPEQVERDEPEQERWAC